MSFILTNRHGQTRVVSPDEIDEFGHLMDSPWADDPREMINALTRFRMAHPGHTDALAHLLRAAAELGEPLQVLRYVHLAKKDLAVGLASVTHPCSLDAALPVNQPVLRLGRNAALAAWGIREWRLADTLGVQMTRIDHSDDAVRIATDIYTRAEPGSERLPATPV